MDGRMGLEEIYARRLEVVLPTRREVQQIRRVYKRHVVEDAAEVIAVLQALGHEIHIISGGLEEPVGEFGVYLGVPRENIRAVGISYDRLAGVWWGEADHVPGRDGSERYIAFEEGALTATDGKGRIIREILRDQRGGALLIGDGQSDLQAGQAVDLFVGIGGVTCRDQVLKQAPVFIHSSSLAPLLCLAAGPSALRRLPGQEHETIVAKTLRLIKRGAITFQDERLERKFNNALNAAGIEPR
jgi:phosphoserine phosphatase